MQEASGKDEIEKADKKKQSLARLCFTVFWFESTENIIGVVKKEYGTVSIRTGQQPSEEWSAPEY